jgi:hypothetical protein
MRKGGSEGIGVCCEGRSTTELTEQQTKETPFSTTQLRQIESALEEMCG